MAPAFRGRVVAAMAVPAGLWWLLTGGEARSWLIGAPVVLAAAAATVALAPPYSWTLSPRGVAGFLPYFVWRSAVGGFDVALRALSPSLPIAPALERYVLQLPADGPARVFFANTVNLLPGTLSAELDDEAVLVHVLYASSDTARELQRLEGKVAALFGVTLHSGAPMEAGR